MDFFQFAENTDPAAAYSEAYASPYAYSDDASAKLVQQQAPVLTTTTLWTTQYAPKYFHQLLSNQQLLREIVAWMKTAGQSHHQSQSGSSQSVSSLRNNTLGKSLGKTHGKAHAGALGKSDGKTHRRSILLVSGQTGIGKTCTIRTLANHCGYNLRVDILDSVHSKSLFDARPSMLLLDEIDVNSDRIAQLLKLHSQGKLRVPVVCICTDLYSPALRLLKPHCQIVQLRPPEYQVIASRLQDICNWENLTIDLRSILTLVDITHGDLRAALNALQMLKKKYTVVRHADIAGIQASISMDIVMGWFPLVKEMFHLRTAKEKNNALSSKPVQKAKPRVDEGSFSGIFSMSSSSSDLFDRNVNNASSSSSSRNSYYMQSASKLQEPFTQRLAKLVQNAGDSNRIMNACFENYLSSPKIDTLGTNSTCESRIVQQGHFIDFIDRVSRKVETTQRFELMGYADYALTSFHGLFATAKQMDIQFPKSDFQFHTEKRDVNGVIETVLLNMDKSTKMQWGGVRSRKDELVMDVLPYLSVISAPQVNPVNIQKLKPQEEKVITSLCDTLGTFGFRLLQQKNEIGGFEPLDKLCVLNWIKESDRSDGMKRRSIKDLGYTVKQLISNRIEHSLYKRADISVKEYTQKSSSKVETPGKKENTKEKGKQRKRKPESKLDNEGKEEEDADKEGVSTSKKAKQARDLQFNPLELEQAKVYRLTQAPTDFFGRSIAVTDKENQTLQQQQESKKKRAVVVFKFKEGYLNAVRKPVSIDTFH